MKRVVIRKPWGWLELEILANGAVVCPEDALLVLVQEWAKRVREEEVRRVTWAVFNLGSGVVQTR